MGKNKDTEIMDEPIHSPVEKWAIPVFTLLAVLLIVLSRTPGSLYRFYMDDGPAEIITVLCQLLAGGFFLATFIMLWRKGYWLWVLLLLAVFSFWVAGEEISWGQRIFIDHIPAFFIKYNSNQSINVHNLFFFEPYEDEITLSIVLTWGLFLPALAFLFYGIRKFCWRIGFPCPGNATAIGIIIVLALEVMFFFSRRDYTEYAYETIEIGFSLAWALAALGMFLAKKTALEWEE
ncbi:MAG: hypothetical protein J7M18_02110 [Candidatus Eremiobacteraeota bacterium]|nr:hypothetical protein [Candidatus Eremiobacteraeota bacterium]